MKTKLTLSIDKDLVRFAREQAKRDKTSVSGMFSKFLGHKKERSMKKPVPGVDSMVGTLKQYRIDDSKEAIRSAYAKKHID
jgi:hypothetical protein